MNKSEVLQFVEWLNVWYKITSDSEMYEDRKTGEKKFVSGLYDYWYKEIKTLE